MRSKTTPRERHSQPEERGSRLPLYGRLFAVNLFISSFTFGGGYVVVPMIRKYLVSGKKQSALFGEEELLSMAAIAQSTPGAIAVNLSALAGFRAAGLPGALISAAAAVLPPLLLLSLISHWYAAFAANSLIAAVLKGMQAGAAALIVEFIVDMTGAVVKENSPLRTAMIPAAFAASFLFRVPVLLILAAGCALCLLQLLTARLRGRHGRRAAK